MYEVFEHTADVGLRIRAANVNDLFAEAARGLFALMVEDPDAVQPRMQLPIELKANNLENLFFDWLAELLYTFHSRKLVLCRFQVHVEGTSLRAEAAGEPINPARHELSQEVKAITYHRLAVKREGEQWLAEVIVDV